MSTTAQILANRQNSILSTGPTSAAGKAASSQSAITHGLSAADPVLEYEERSAFLALVDAYRADFTPQTPHQEFLVQEMAGARWKIERANRIENAILTGMIESSDTGASAESKIAQAMMSKEGDALARLDRHRAALERTYHRCARELRAVQKLQNEANSQQLAENKFNKLMKEYVFAPPPGPEPGEPETIKPPQAVKPAPKPGPCIPRNKEEWKANCQYAMTNPALRL